MKHPLTGEPMQQTTTMQSITFRGVEVSYKHISWVGTEGDSYTTTEQDNKNLESVLRSYEKNKERYNRDSVNSLLWILLILDLICVGIIFLR